MFQTRILYFWITTATRTTTKQGNKKLFYKYINSKRKTTENLHSLLNEAGNVTTEDKEKAKVLNAFFTSVFNRPVILEVLSLLR